jgi:hypothetical protein
LQCDFALPECGQCIRVQIRCSGYRDTGLRIRDESQSVERKAIKSYSHTNSTPQSFSLSLDVQAREAFFLHYVTGTLRTWEFLAQYSDPVNTPHHLNLSIDAVSMAYLSHQVYSNSSLTMARERYLSAIKSTTKALRSLEQVSSESTLVSSLLLDLYEKITGIEPEEDKAWTSHVNGALALVELRGLGSFQRSEDLRILGRLGFNLLISCVASGSEVPNELRLLRDYCEKHMETVDPKWKLSGLMMSYADFRSQTCKGQLSYEKHISLALALESRLEKLALEMPCHWCYQTWQTSQDATNKDTSWEQQLDVYPSRHVTQTWNVCRLVRILLNGSILSCARPSAEVSSTIGIEALETKARENIEILAREICASAPQYLACRQLEAAHHHTPAEKLNCYTIIYPLYVAGQSKYISALAKERIIERLQFIGSHFDIRNSQLAAQMLVQGQEITPWKMYALLGSYAFAA